MKLLKRFIASEIPTQASALAYHTLLGIIPVVGISFWYLKTLGLTEKYIFLIRQFFLSQLNVSSSKIFENYFDKLTFQVAGNSWGWIGLVIFIYTVWNLIGKFGVSLDRILTSQREEKDLFRIHSLWIFFRRLFVMLFLPLALVISIVLSIWIRKDSVLNFIFRDKQIGPWAALPLAWITTIFAVTLVYYLVPKIKVPFKEAVRAALVVGPLSEVVRFLFGIYNHYAVSVHKIYGVLAIVPLFILWVQLSWTLLLSGALLIRVPKEKK